MSIRRLTRSFGILSAITFMVAYVSSKAPQFVFFWGSGSSTHRVLYTRAEHPRMFIVTTIAFVVIGLLLLVGAFWSHFRSTESAEPDGGLGSPAKARVWQVVNTLSVIASLYAGWAVMQAEALRGTNLDAIFCGIIFAVMLLFPLGAVSYSIFGAKQETLRRPSWSRSSLDWWHDPLQCLLLSSCFVGGMSVGAVFHLKGTTAAGFWMFMAFCGMFAGLVIGQLIVYAVFRDRIVET